MHNLKTKINDQNSTSFDKKRLDLADRVFYSLLALFVLNFLVDPFLVHHVTIADPFIILLNFNIIGVFLLCVIGYLFRKT